MTIETSHSSNSSGAPRRIAQRAIGKPPSDQAQREQALDPAKSFIVQAPAGSGKTTLLVERYLHLLTLVNQPEEILAITFTRAAAAEMHKRIIESLTQDTELVRLIRRRDEQLGWQLITNPKRMKVQTIDSFAVELATQIPGIDSAHGMRVEENPRELYEQAAREVLRLPFSKAPERTFVSDFLSQFDNDAGRAETMLIAMLAKRDQWLSVSQQIGFLAAQNKQSVRIVIEQALKELHEQTLLPVMSALTSQDHEHLNQLAQATQRSNHLSDLLPLILTGKNTIRSRLTRREHAIFAENPELKAAMLEWYADLDERGLTALLAPCRLLPSIDLALHDEEQLLAVCMTLALAGNALEAIFQRERSIDFSGMLMRAMTGLHDADGPTDLALLWDYRIRHVLVDEFQDTSRSQYEFFCLLTEGWQPDDGNTFFAVGDPMQSIYRFRDADVSIFSQCWEEGLPTVLLQPLSLETNFRSRRCLVEWNNDLFAGLFPNQAMAHLGAVRFTRASAIHADLDDTKLLCIRYADHAAELNAIISRITTIQAKDPHADIGLLARSRAQLPQLLQALTDSGIAYSGTDIDPLANEPIIEDLQSLLCCLITPSDRLAWFCLLRTPMVGLDLFDLHQVAQAESPLEGCVARISASQHGGIDRLLSALAWAKARLYEIPLCEVLEGCWIRLGGVDAYPESGLTHARRWFELIEELGDKAYAAERVEDALGRLYAQTSSEAKLKIMTIHKSKGLQFDHVLVPFLSRQPPSDTKPVLLWRPTRQGLLVGVRDSDIHAWMDFEEKSRLRNEDKRLLYVAFTRAKESLLVSYTVPPEKKSQGLAKLIDDYSEICSDVDVAERIMIEAGHEYAHDSQPHLESAMLRHLPQDYQPLTAQALPKSAAEVGSANSSTSEQNGDNAPTVAGFESQAASQTGPQASLNASNRYHIALGNLVHRGLAWMGEQQQLKLSAVSAHLERWITELEAPIDDWAQVVGDAKLHLATTLADETGRWLLTSQLSHQRSEFEYRVTRVVDQVPRQFIIDRLFTTGDVVWVVDYKTALPDDGEELGTFLAKETQRYRAQLLGYKEVVAALDDDELRRSSIRLALYFTGLSYLHEIEA